MYSEGVSHKAAKFYVDLTVHRLAGVSAISPTPILPTPISPTYYRSVPFRLLMQNVFKYIYTCNVMHTLSEGLRTTVG